MRDIIKLEAYLYVAELCAFYGGGQSSFMFTELLQKNLTF
jgi:hypothetical protein